MKAFPRLLIEELLTSYFPSSIEDGNGRPSADQLNLNETSNSCLLLLPPTPTPHIEQP